MTTRKATRSKKSPTARTQGEREPDFLWAGRPVFRCKHTGCTYERMENLADVLEHETGHQPPARESRNLGADGEPLQTSERRPE